MDNPVVVEVVDDIENRPHDGDGIVLGKLALCEDTVNARLEALVLKGCAGRGQGERQTMLGWLRLVRRSIEVQALASFPLRLEAQPSVDKAKSRQGRNGITPCRN